MYYYQPPKSSVWGHALRNMPAARARLLLKRFLDTAAADFRFSGGALNFLGSKDYLSEFEALLGIASQHGAFHKLTELQCELSLDAVANDEKHEGRKARSCILIQSFTILRWRLPRVTAETPSEVSMYYGQGAYISTCLQFESVEDFHQIQNTLRDLGLCKLNEKHLKKVREKKSK
jgi:hypothetical protein